MSPVETQASSDSTRQRNRNRITADTSVLITINRVLILGNKITRDFIIQRELTLKPGDTVRLQQIPLILEKDNENGTADILVEVSERWYTFPVPILELADRNFNEWWQNYNHDLKRLNYGLKLYQYNVRGRNETLLLTAKFGFTKVFRVSYRMPYLDKKRKQGLIFDFNYDERNNIAYRTIDNILTYARADEKFKVTRSASITYTYRNSFYHYHGFSLETIKNQISDSLVQLNPEYYGSDVIKTQNTTALSYQYVYEKRDFITYPLTGSYFSASIRHQGILKSDDLIKTDLNAGYSKYVHLGKKYYLSNYTNAYVSFQTHIPYGSYSALG